ncbi:porphobilinogen synthase [Oxyplasma meridianum]|uniref:Delta-aminolevulinic acid dehydratase n=1 Tax=Oxyplasma meridianum TaxID=3073602 RepID=A0AAX4NIE5_9ARCH
MFPATRMRRIRTTPRMRDLVAETKIDPSKLIMPVFVDENLKNVAPINSMPGIYTYPLESVGKYLENLESKGISNILLFGVPAHKDPMGTSSYDPNGAVQKTIKLAKENTSLTVMTDLCLCEYTDHGHCGIVEKSIINNDLTLEVYDKIAISYAESGSDVIAPSGMMDGQVGSIRRALDQAGFDHTSILAYSAKYSSNLFGPFREAVKSSPGFGDRKTYQMDWRNSREAMREIELDIKEGADMIMVKPAIFYLDIIAQARRRYDLPLAAYSVSGEYSMIKKAILEGYMNENIILESLTSVFRAGADMIITYFAEWFMENVEQ